MNKGRAWTAEDVGNYQAWIDSFITEYEADGKVADCADLAIESLISFAEKEGLHVEITTRVKPRKVISEVDFKTYRAFVKAARSQAGAQNLADKQNTKPVDLKDALAGDLLIFDWSDSDHWHTMIFINQKKLWMGNVDNGDQVPIIVSDKSERNGNGPDYYLKHSDLRGGKPRRWAFFFGVT